MNSTQILNYHFTLDLKDIEFLEVSQAKELISDSDNELKFQQTYKAEIKKKMESLISFLAAKNKALIYFSISFMEMLKKEEPSTFISIQKFVKNGQIELVGSCGYQSFSFLCHPELFKKEVALHKQAYQQYFDREANIFINTACLFNDNLIKLLEGFGYEIIIATANQWHLSGMSEAQTFQSIGHAPMKILLSNGDITSGNYLSLTNGYGSSYGNNQIENSSDDSLKKLLSDRGEPYTYSTNMPLSSPEWLIPISNYLTNSFQKAIFKECNRLVETCQKKLSDEDWKVIMLICQPDKLIQLSQAAQNKRYQLFIHCMNTLTAIGLKYN